MRKGEILAMSLNAIIVIAKKELLADTDLLLKNPALFRDMDIIHTIISNLEDSEIDKLCYKRGSIPNTIQTLLFTRQ